MVVDKLLACDAFVFLAGALWSFMSIRDGQLNGRLESRGEVVFIVGLGVLAVVTVALAFAIRRDLRATYALFFFAIESSSLSVQCPMYLLRTERSPGSRS